MGIYFMHIKPRRNSLHLKARVLERKSLIWDLLALFARCTLSVQLQVSHL